jgi:hypothetical protein
VRAGVDPHDRSRAVMVMRKGNENAERATRRRRQGRLMPRGAARAVKPATGRLRCASRAQVDNDFQHGAGFA